MTDTKTLEPTQHAAIEKIQADMASDLREIELGVLTNFSLADAIREGSKHTTQKIGGYVDKDSACALGAAYLSAQARGYIRR